MSCSSFVVHRFQDPLMPILQGDYLELRELPEQDLPNLLKVYQGTPLYFDGLGYDVSRLALADVQGQYQAARQDGRCLLGVYHIVTGLLIGVADIQIKGPEPGSAAILLLLIWGGFQRQGYGQECLALLASWLNSEHSVGALYAVATANDE